MSNPSSENLIGASGGGVAASLKDRATLRVLAGPATGAESNLIQSAIFPIGCFKVDDIRFQFDSSFILPDMKDELQSLAKLLAEKAEKAPSKPGAALRPAPITIFGHADPSGDDEYNKALSGRRAAAVYGLLTRRVEVWEDLFSNGGKFASVAAGDKWGEQSVATMRATLGLPPAKGTGTAGSRASLFRQYMDAICVDSAALPFTVDKTEGFLTHNKDPGGKGDFQGCSEFNPTMRFSKAEEQAFEKQTDKAARNAENAQNRRVMVLVYRPGSRVSTTYWPCPKAKDPTAGCRKRFWSDGEKRRAAGDVRREFKETEDTFACRFYQRMTGNSPCERLALVDIEIAMFIGFEEKDAEDAQLVVLKGDGSEFKVLSASAGRRVGGYLVFDFKPTDLPNPVKMRARLPAGEFPVGGQFDPFLLAAALQRGDHDAASEIFGDDPPPPGGGPEEADMEEPARSQ